MESELGLVRVIRAFLEERDDADPESQLVARVSDLKDIRSTLTSTIAEMVVEQFVAELAAATIESGSAARSGRDDWSSSNSKAS